MEFPPFPLRVFGGFEQRDEEEGIKEMCKKDYGDGSIMRENPRTLADNLGIPIVAMQIIACAELGRRFFERNSLSRPTIRPPAKFMTMCGHAQSFQRAFARFAPKHSLQSHPR